MTRARTEKEWQAEIDRRNRATHRKRRANARWMARALRRRRAAQLKEQA
jgi:hypothetical protein